LNRQPHQRSRCARAALLACALCLPITALAGPSSPNMGIAAQGHPGRAQIADPSERETEPAASLSEAQVPLQCPLAEREYRKSLLLSAFALRQPATANAGTLHGAEQQLPELLGERLVQSQSVWRYKTLGQSLPSADPAPYRRAQQVRQLAGRTDSQLVLTGELLDMSVASMRDTQAPGLITRSRNSLVNRLNLNPDWDTRQRDLVLQLQLLDGATGEPVFERQYRTRGAWNPKRGERMAFGSPQFWETNYGQEVEALLDRASAEFGEAIRCQPLVGKLEPTRPGQPLVLQAGVNQGLEPGDRLPLYKVAQRSIPGAYRQNTAHLIDSGKRVTVTEAHQDYSLVRLESELSLRGSYLALTPRPALETLSQH